MQLPEFADFADDTRLWVYPFPRSLTPDEKAVLGEEMANFVGCWNSHGARVKGAWAVVDEQFVLLTGHTGAGIGGCSIDSSTRVLKGVQGKIGLNPFSHHLVYYRAGEQVKAVTRPEFQRLVNEGQVTADTVVYDLTLETLGDLRHGRLRTRCAQSWHAQAFRLAPVTA